MYIPLGSLYEGKHGLLLPLSTRERTLQQWGGDTSWWGLNQALAVIDDTLECVQCVRRAVVVERDRALTVKLSCAGPHTLKRIWKEYHSRVM